MEYFKDLDRLAKISFEKFMLYIDEHRNLLVNTSEDEDNNTEIEVTYYDFENGDEELIGRFYFDENGDYIKGE